jgi:hypothetical protein
MAVVNKLTTLMPAFGAPTEYVTLIAQTVTNASTTTFTLTGFVNFVRSGRLRFKTTAAGTALVTGFNVTATDGTTTVLIIPGGPVSITASVLLDWLFAFISELNLTTITVNVTLGAGTNSTADLEVTGNP